MGTSYQTVFDAFLSKINDPDLIELEDFVLEYDMKGLLNSALPYFLFPKVSLDIDPDSESFESDLSAEEVNLIAVLMKREWFTRCINDTNVTVQKWAESDFEFKSQASHLNALSKTKRQMADVEVQTLLSNYSRKGEGNKPFDYTKLAGK